MMLQNNGATDTMVSQVTSEEVLRKTWGKNEKYVKICQRELMN